MFHQPLLPRSQQRGIYVTQAQGRLNGDTSLPAHQPRPGILNRFDNIRLDGHDPTRRTLLRSDRSDHIHASGTNIRFHLCGSDIRVNVNCPHLILQDQDVSKGIVVTLILFGRDFYKLWIGPGIKIERAAGTAIKFHPGSKGIQGTHCIRVILRHQHADAEIVCNQGGSVPSQETGNIRLGVISQHADITTRCHFRNVDRKELDLRCSSS